MESELAEKTSSKMTASSSNLEVENHQLKSISAIRSSRRTPSRDLDQIPSRNSYSSSLPEGIHNAAFSLPACLSKACSILEAVADLNSTGGHSTNAGNMFDKWGERRGSFLETEIAVEDDLMEPSMHRYVTVRQSRAELEPQESAGSNSFVSHPWAAASSGWEPDSVDSARRWRSNDDEEVEQIAKMPSLSQQQHHSGGIQGRRPRGTINGSGNGHPPPESSENNTCGKASRAQISGLSATAAPTATI